jgi:hypothetical protein
MIYSWLSVSMYKPLATGFHVTSIGSGVPPVKIKETYASDLPGSHRTTAAHSSAAKKIRSTAGSFTSG